MAQLNKETKQVTKQVTVDEQVVTGMTLNRKEAYILAVIGTMNKSNARVITRNMKGKLGEYGLTQQDLEDFLTKIEGPELVIPKGLPKVEPLNVAPKKVPGKFEKGDRVVFNQNYGSSAKKGDTGTVAATEPGTWESPGDETLVTVRLDKGYNSTAYSFRLDHLKEQPKLRVGAKIRIVDPYMPQGYSKGAVLIVGEINERTGGVYCHIHGYGRAYVTAKEFEVIG